ncbi:hypothetical protein FRC01_008466, partial [Tulasnella sp. 417]
RAELEPLAQWRIDPSSIKFPEKAPEFHGSFGSVSRALWVVPSNREDGADQSANPKKEVESATGVPDKSSPSIPESGGDRDVSGEKWGGRKPIVGTAATLWSKIWDFTMWGLGRRGATSPSSSSDQACKTVAVKRMKISGDFERILGLTLREARFLFELSHPNIIKLDGFVEDVCDNMIWLVFPWEERGRLSDFVASANWEIPERISLIHDVAKGVEYLHSRQPPIRHGDLKSINILVNSENHAVITDFGSARRLTGKDLEKGNEGGDNTPQPELGFEAKLCASTNTITLTSNGYTVRWAAPELLNGDEGGLWSDIWALGWVAYEVMTGSIPFEGLSDGNVICKVVQGDLPSMAEDTRMLLIRALYSLMMECWSDDPGKRPTAEECRKSIDWMASYTVLRLTA